jgi:hypothetical protein
MIRFELLMLIQAKKELYDFFIKLRVSNEILKKDR